MLVFSGSPFLDLGEVDMDCSGSPQQDCPKGWGGVVISFSESHSPCSPVTQSGVYSVSLCHQVPGFRVERAPGGSGSSY